MRLHISKRGCVRPSVGYSPIRQIAEIVSFTRKNCYYHIAIKACDPSVAASVGRVSDLVITSFLFFGCDQKLLSDIELINHQTKCV